MTATEANTAVRKYLDDVGYEEGVSEPILIRDLAEAVGCSTGNIAKTPTWKGMMESREKSGKASGRKPKAVPMTKKADTVLGAKDKNLERADERMDQQEMIDKLTNEQAADHEPSPLIEDRPDEPSLKVWSNNAR